MLSGDAIRNLKSALENNLMNERKINSRARTNKFKMINGNNPKMSLDCDASSSSCSSTIEYKKFHSSLSTSTS